MAQDQKGEKPLKCERRDHAHVNRGDRIGMVCAIARQAKTAELRATHLRSKRRYKKRKHMPSKLDPHLAAVESWIATDPQNTALAIARRLAAIDPPTFSEKQHSIVQRLMRSLRRQTTFQVQNRHNRALRSLPANSFAARCIDFARLVAEL
jgi:hypothetical protein